MKLDLAIARESAGTMLRKRLAPVVAINQFECVVHAVRVGHTECFAVWRWPVGIEITLVALARTKDAVLHVLVRVSESVPLAIVFC
jgi:hypothetical protein